MTGKKRKESKLSDSQEKQGQPCVLGNPPKTSASDLPSATRNSWTLVGFPRVPEHARLRAPVRSKAFSCSFATRHWIHSYKIVSLPERASRAVARCKYHAYCTLERFPSTYDCAHRCVRKPAITAFRWTNAMHERRASCIRGSWSSVKRKLVFAFRSKYVCDTYVIRIDTYV